jgi:hypothetical protein
MLAKDPNCNFLHYCNYFRPFRSAGDADTGAFQNRGSSLCRAHVHRPQQLLNRADVVALLDQVGCKAVPQGVTADLWMDFSLAGSLGYRPLHRPVKDRLAADSRARIV